MIPRGSRIALWCVALLLSVSLYLKGRVPAETGGDPALFRSRGETVTVRLVGDFPRPGVYRLPKGASVRAAIKMTLPELPLSPTVNKMAEVRLAAGDVVTLAGVGGGSPLISLGKMGARERMLLGIPLDPDLLEPGEWSLLPGIGPVLSERIAADRHKNGAFGSVEGLKRVPGIGDGKLSLIRKFF